MNLLLSIKPEYTEKIFSGQKKYEFRKQKPKLPINIVYIYESHPSKKIVGWFNIESIFSDSPEVIWEKCKEFGGIKEKKYFTYCNGNKIIHAFKIDEIYKFKNPINPFEIFPAFKPPQNFSYFNDPLVPRTLEDVAGFKLCPTID
jgi:predicted transcriptional regulator